MNIVTTVLVIVVLLNYVNTAQYPDCVTCPDGSIPLSPLSYNIVRSNVFNGTQPSNEGCTNGPTVSRRVTINCRQGTTLIDCDQRYSDSANYSDLSDYFIWSRNESISEQVSITFRFYQQIKISRIGLLFWNSPSNSITIPDVRLYYGNYFDGSILLTQQITSITTNLPNRNISGMHILNIDMNNPRQYQYLRIEMSFYSEWIFLGEVQFCGNTAPFHITHPSTNNDVQIVSPTVTMASVTCLLNITIPDFMIITWEHNGQVSIVGFHDNAIQTSHGTTLLIQNPQSSDAGVYQCTFNNAPYDGWVLRRYINLMITSPEISDPPNDSQVVTFNNSINSSQLMCSLNSVIPSSMIVTWFHNGTVAMAPPNEATTTGRTTTLVIRNPQSSDASVYQCVFNDTVNGWILSRNISVLTASTADINSTITSISTSASTTSSTTNITTAIIKNVATSTDSSNVGTASITDVEITTATKTITNYPVTTITTNASTTSSFTSYSTTINANNVTVVIKTAVADATITTTPMITDTDAYISIATSSTLLPTPSSALYDNNNSSSVGVIVAIVVLVVVVIITITVVVVGIIVVWKERKSKHDSTTAESVYYSTIDETKLQSGFKNKPEAPHDNEVNDKQLSKENSQYMEIVIRADCSIADKVAMQDNPSYSLPSKHQVKMQDNPSYATVSGTKQ